MLNTASAKLKTERISGFINDMDTIS
jgi:hypothetical protein